MGANNSVQLSDAIAEYQLHRMSNHIAKTTLRNERTILNKFLAVVGNVWVHAIDDRHVDRFFTELSKTKQPQSQRNDYNTLTNFFKWARRRKYMGKDADPMFGRRRPPESKRERNRVHFSQFPALLDAAGARCERDRAAVAMLLYTLCRDQEIANLQVRDVDLAAGEILVRVYKTNEEDRMPICEELDVELRRWLTYYTEQVGVLEPNYYLIPSRDTRGVRGDDGLFVAAEQLSLKPDTKVRALGDLCKPALHDIGFPIKDSSGKRLGEGAHTVRRSGARALFDRLVGEGFDGALRLVQSMLHHASVTTTEGYLGITADRNTRNQLLRGRRMFARENVVDLRSVSGGQEG